MWGSRNTNLNKRPKIVLFPTGKWRKISTNCVKSFTLKTEVSWIVDTNHWKMEMFENMSRIFLYLIACVRVCVCVCPCPCPCLCVSASVCVCVWGGGLFTSLSVWLYVCVWVHVFVSVCVWPMSNYKNIAGVFLNNQGLDTDMRSWETQGY